MAESQTTLEPCPLKHHVSAGLKAYKTGRDPRIICLDCGLSLAAPDWTTVYERWQSRSRVSASVAPVVDEAWAKTAAANLNKANLILSDATPEELDQIAAIIQASLPSASGDLISRTAAKAALCYMCADPERYKPAQPIEGSKRLFHFQGSSNWNAGQCFAQAINTVPAAAPASTVAPVEQPDTVDQFEAWINNYWPDWRKAEPYPVELMRAGWDAAMRLANFNELALKGAVDYTVELEAKLAAPKGQPDHLTDLQQAIIEHDDDMARLDRNTLVPASPADIRDEAETYFAHAKSCTACGPEGFCSEGLRLYNASATPPSTRAKAAAEEIGAWIFMLEQPLTSETDLRVATDHVESIILKRCFSTEGEDTK